METHCKLQRTSHGDTVGPRAFLLLGHPRGGMSLQLFRRHSLDPARPTGLPFTGPARHIVLNNWQEEPASRASVKASSELGGTRWVLGKRPREACKA